VFELGARNRKLADEPVSPFRGLDPDKRFKVMVSDEQVELDPA